MEGARKLTGSRHLSLAHASWPAAIMLLLGGVALLPRVIGLADFITTDEAYHLVTFTDRFGEALAERRWADTVLLGHPAVTLWWIGALGLAIERAAIAAGWATVSSAVEHLAWLRLPAALLETLCIPVGYLLLRRLFAPATALIAAALWATSPYLIAHARVYHLDALLTTFATFCVLCVLIGCRAERPRRWIAAAGCCAGLALLTKGPALILLPLVGLLLLWQAPAAGWAMRLRRTTGWYALWLGVAALTFALLWPAMWADPRRALGAFFGEILQNGARPNGDGQFFLGRAIGDPGPLFYIVSDLFRMTPLMMLGLLGAPLALWRRPTTLRQGDKETGGQGDKETANRRLRPILQSPISNLQSPRRWSEEQQSLLALVVFVLFWTLVMTLGPKKFDRYTLPTWPALLVLAAAGWKFWLWDVGAWLGKRWASLTPLAWARLRLVLIAGALALELVPLARYHPYYLSYYNPLLGGGAAAQRALLIGWGEGMDQAGAYLRTRPDIGYGPVLSALPRTLRPFVPVPVADVTELGKTPANYAVVYLESIQRGANPAIYAAIRQTVPLRRITIHGIDYAEIYQLPRPFERPIDARFGDALLLRGVTLKRLPGQLVVTPAWDVRGWPAADYQAFVHVLDAAGRAVAQIDVSPGGGDAPPTSAWEPGQQVAVPLPLALPDGLPSGEYLVTLGLYDPKTNQRLPLSGGVAADATRAGPNALLLDTIALP